jgi:hypothetical protein
MTGGIQTFIKKSGRKPQRYAAVISVNASTDPEP